MSTQTLGQVTAFGHYMKQWRRQRGLSQVDLAVRADVSQRHVSFLETGRSRFGENVVHKVAEALQAPSETGTSCWRQRVWRPLIQKYP